MRGGGRPSPHLVVLVGGDGDEGGLREDVGAEGGVLGAEAVVLVRFHDVQTGLVFVHGVQDDLGEGRRRGHPVGMEGAQPGAFPPPAQGRRRTETPRNTQPLPQNHSRLPGKGRLRCWGREMALSRTPQAGAQQGREVLSKVVPQLLPPPHTNPRGARAAPPTRAGNKRGT